MKDAQPRRSGSGSHATAVLIGEAGVLIRGESGAGKSNLALALLAFDSPCRLVRLIGDDRLVLRAAHDRLIAGGRPEIAGQIEQRGEGILRFAAQGAAVMRCVVDLVADRDIPPRLPEEADLWTSLHGVALKRLLLPRRMAAAEAARRVWSFVHRLER